VNPVIEFAVGISILTALPVVGSYVASAWLLLVAVNLTLGGYFDIAVRDVVLSIGTATIDLAGCSRRFGGITGPAFHNETARCILKPSDVSEA
jgi:hypothetical protein